MNNNSSSNSSFNSNNTKNLFSVEVSNTNLLFPIESTSSPSKQKNLQNTNTSPKTPPSKNECIVITDDGTITYNAPDRPTKKIQRVVDLTENLSVKRLNFEETLNELDKIVINLASYDMDKMYAENLQTSINNYNTNSNDSDDSDESSESMDINDYNENDFGPDVEKTNTPKYWELYNKTNNSNTSNSSQQLEKRNCVICLDGEPTHIFVPCCHLCLCQKCVNVITQTDSFKKECFICKKPYLSISKVFYG